MPISIRSGERIRLPRASVCQTAGKVRFARGLNLSRRNRGFESLAEGEGFEPPVSFPTTVFKTVTFGRSVSPPGAKSVIQILAGASQDADFWQNWGIFATVKTLGDVAERPKAAPC